VDHAIAHHFVTGVDEAFWNEVRQEWRSGGCAAGPHTSAVDSRQTVHTSATDGSGRRRVEERSAEGKVQRAFSHTKKPLQAFGKLDIFLPRCAHDIRVGVAFEGAEQEEDTGGEEETHTAQK
jgi:hypothetical protein